MKATAPTQRKLKGNQAELLARRHLEQQGLEFAQANFLCKTGEIDLIMRERELMVFVEVRYREDVCLGDPLETVNRSKQRKLIRSASYFLQQQYGNRWPPCRFDVVGVSGNLDQTPTITWIENAFGQ